MATIRRVKRKRGEAYQICFAHPKTSKTIRKVVWVSRSEAEKIKKQIEADLAFGRFNIDNKNSMEMDQSWKTLETKYKRYCKANKSSKTYKRELCVFKAFNEFLCGDLLIKEITNNTIECFRNYRLEKGVKPASVALEMRHLKVVFNMGIKWKYCSDNPVIGVKQPKSDIIKIRFLLREEVNTLLKVIEENNHPEFLKLIKAYLNTGARRIELLPPLFTWNNVMINDRKILIQGKRDMKRFLPINDTLYEILVENKRNKTEFPFQFKPDYVSHKIKYYYKIAGIEGANLHSLRKTFGSLLLQNGAADLFTVSKLLGHSSVNTTEKYYVDLLDENFYNSVGKLSELI